MLSRSCKYFLFFFFFGCVLFGTSQITRACTCGPRPTVLDSYDWADVVIIVRVLSVEKAENTNERHYVDGVKSATMRVEKVFKGNLKVRDELVFGQGGGADCIWTFNEKSIGDEYLFYVTSPEKYSDRSYLPSQDPKLWFAGGCGRSTSVETATDDLLYLENMDKVRGRTRISGTLGGWRNPDLDVAGKKIRIIGPKKTYEAKTDRHGVYEIYDLPPGRYLIEPETPPGWKIEGYSLRYSASVERNGSDEERSTARQVPIILEPKKHAGLDLAFEIDNVVRGKVLGPNGKPMVGVCVYLWTRDQDKVFGPSDCTDENGRFEITSVPSGDYVAAANRDGKLSSGEPFETIFYPNVSERARAAIITIGPGDAINNINIIVPKLADTITIEGVLRYSDGKPAAEEWVKFKALKAGDNIDGDVGQQTDAAGRFSLTVLKGLTGEVTAEVWLYEGRYKNCPKVDELLAKRRSTTVHSNIIKLESQQNFYNLELTFPFPRCEKASD